MKAVIFDIDDTLYPYAPCNEAGEAAMFEEICRLHDMTRPQFDELLKNAKDIVKLCNHDTAACHNRMLYSQKMCEIMGCFSPENTLSLYNSYWDAFLDRMELFDGAFELLCSLKEKGVKIGFCTDLTVHIQMRKLIRLNISHIPHAVVTSEECGKEKPHRIMFETILEKLGVEAQDAVMTGDSEKKDVCGASDCGITPVLFGRKSSRWECAENFYRASQCSGKDVIMKLPEKFDIREIMRFLVGGSSAVLTDLIVYKLLLSFGVDVGAAKAVSYVAGAAVGFVINKLWTFKSKSFSAAEIGKYILLYAFSAAVNTLVNSTVLRLTKLEIFAFLCATGISTIINFLGQKFLVFCKIDPKE